MMGEPVGRQDHLFYEFDLEDMVLCDLLRRPVKSDSSQPSCRHLRFGLNAHEMTAGPHVIRGMSGE